MATPDDHALAADLATRAGALLIEVRGYLASGDSSSEALKREGDQRSHEFLMDALAGHRPHDAVHDSYTHLTLPPSDLV